MSDRLGTEAWESLTSLGETFTCYSSAIATWVAWSEPVWRDTVNPGLWLTLSEAGHGLFGFSHFPPSQRGSLGLVRHASDDAEGAVEAVLEEVGRSGRAIVAGDGFHLPWHVAHGKQHVPHWFVLATASGTLTVVDPFACRNDLGWQSPARQAVEESALPQLIIALPHDNPVFVLREAFAFGDDARPLAPGRFQWFAHEDVEGVRAPQGSAGPDAVLRLAEQFRDHGQDPAAYRQVDDLWSIARHRAFLAGWASRVGELQGWVEQHAQPLARRWAHIPPLLMQATLALGAGRDASTSVSDTLEELAQREVEAGAAL